jgi:hypothetical protein
MNAAELYFKEIRQLKFYILIVLVIMLLSYSVYFFLDEMTIARIGDEDHLFEYMTSLCFLLCSVIFMILSYRNRNIILLLLSVGFLIGFGEEISWGQRILGFATPESLHAINVQKEFNFHNIATWEINFLFKVFTLGFGIALPFLVFHFSIFRKISMKLRVPVPPISLGIFFLVDWLFFKFFLVFVLHSGYTDKYYFAVTEIYEFITSFILLTISFYFLYYNKYLVEGADIKDQIDNLKEHHTAGPKAAKQLISVSH